MNYEPKRTTPRKDGDPLAVEDLGLSQQAVAAICWVLMDKEVVISRLGARQATLQTVVDNLTIKALWANREFSNKLLREIQTKLKEHNLELRKE